MTRAAALVRDVSRRMRETDPGTPERPEPPLPAPGRSGAAEGSRAESVRSSAEGSAPAEDPIVAEAALREATGRGWDEWCAVIDAWPGSADGHAAVARHLIESLGVPGWWAQSITVGWERRTGRRRAHQRPDGTFEVSVSRTVPEAVETLRSVLLDDAARTELFPGHDTQLRSRSDAKSIRFALGPGVALIAFTPKGEGHTQITVAFSKLAAAEDVEVWRTYWRQWLAAVAEAAAAEVGAG